MAKTAAAQQLKQAQPDPAPAEPGPAVAQIATSLANTGISEDIIAMGAYLLHENCRSVVISGGGAQTEAVLETGSEHFDLPFEATYGFFAAVRMGFRLSQTLSASKVDVVHLHSQNLVWPVYIACRLSGKALVVHVQDPLGSVKQAPLSVLKKTPLTTPTQTKKQQLVELGVPDALITVTPPGYSSQHFTPAQTDADKVDALWSEWDVPTATRVIYAPTRQLEETAGLETFITALGPLRQMPFKAIISGDYSHNHDQFTALWQQVEATGLSDHVLFVGSPHHEAATYGATDVVVCPHRYAAPVSRALLKAQAMGKPVIATDLSDHREIIEHDESGWLFPVDDHRKLTELLKKALADNIRLHKMGGHGAKIIPQQHSYKTRLPDVFRLYQELAGNSGKPQQQIKSN